MTGAVAEIREGAGPTGADRATHPGKARPRPPGTPFARGPIMRRALTLAYAAPLLLAACGGDDRPDGGLRPDGGSGVDAGPLSDGGEGPDTGDQAILDRPSRGLRECVVSSPVRNLRPQTWPGFGYTFGLEAAASGTHAVLGRIEATAQNPFDPPEDVSVVVSELDAAALEQNRRRLPVDVNSALQARVLPQPDGSVLALWSERDELRLARFPAAGDPSAPVTLQPLPESQGFEVLQRDETLLVYSYSQFPSGPRQLGRVHYRRFTTAGAALGEPRLLFESDAYSDNLSFRPLLVPGEPGFVAVRRETLSGGGGRIVFQRYAADGTAAAPEAEVHSISASGHGLGAGYGFAPSRVAFLALADGFLVAWPHSYSGAEDFVDPKGHTHVELARLDASGRRQGGVLRLQDPTLHRDHEEPELFWHGDLIALSWSHGERIYICGGCIPDHDVQLVLLDPADLGPVSNVAVLDHGPVTGGLLYRRSASLGEQVLVATSIVFHVHREPGLAAFRCAAPD